MDRRQFIGNGSMGFLAFSLAGAEVLLTPRQARAQDLPYSVLNPAEVQAIEILGESLLPGAREAGMAHYIDHQLAAPAEEALLIIRYFDVPPPYAPFYQGGLAAITHSAREAFSKPLEELDNEERIELITQMQKNALPGWQGPPAGLFYFVLRNDAVDVVYGTQEGFERLGIPYQPHIIPPTPW
jgi:hypothetical protein